MTQTQQLALLIYSGVIFCVVSLSNYFIFHQVQSPDAHLQYFLAIPIFILIYLVCDQIHNHFLQKFSSNPHLPMSTLLFKITEFGFYLCLIAFVLISQRLVILILCCQVLNLALLLYAQQKNRLNLFYITPNYDLICIAILAVFITYVPELNQLYPKLTIQIIKWICHLVLIFNLLILFNNLIKHLRYYHTKNPSSELISEP